MRVFVTGATGFVGSAVVQELLRAGHQVLGLARNDANAEALQRAGAQAHRGDLKDLNSLRAGAAASDAVIHTGFIHDFSNFKENCEIDRQAITALGEELAGSNRPLITTSGTAIIAPGQLATEEMPQPKETGFPRVSEPATEEATAKGVRTSIIRLPPTTHGEGDHGFVPILIKLAREKGFAAYVGDGKNRWPAAHRLDAAVLYRLALEKGVAGARYHSVAEEGVPFREIAEAIGRGLNLPVVSLSREEAETHFGWFARFAAIDAPASSAITQQQLGWKPTHPSLLQDINNAGYFNQ